MQLPGSADSLPSTSSRSSSISTGSGGNDQNLLRPVRPPIKKDEMHNRATSSDSLQHKRETRSRSIVAQIFDEAGLQASRRSRRRISVSDDFETTAAFVENLRQKLIKQL